LTSGKIIDFDYSLALKKKKKFSFQVPILRTFLNFLVWVVFEAFEILCKTLMGKEIDLCWIVDGNMT
jgi:hypothetical protein